VIACGQKSLEIFCLSTLLSELGALVLFEINGNYLSYLVVITIGLLVMFVTALFLTSSVSVAQSLRLAHLRRLTPRA
jgi:OpgC protein